MWSGVLSQPDQKQHADSCLPVSASLCRCLDQKETLCLAFDVAVQCHLGAMRCRQVRFSVRIGCAMLEVTMDALCRTKCLQFPRPAAAEVCAILSRRIKNAQKANTPRMLATHILLVYPARAADDIDDKCVLVGWVGATRRQGEARFRPTHVNSSKSDHSTSSHDKSRHNAAPRALDVASDQAKNRKSEAFREPVGNGGRTPTARTYTGLRSLMQQVLRVIRDIGIGKGGIKQGAVRRVAASTQLAPSSRVPGFPVMPHLLSTPHVTPHIFGYPGKYEEPQDNGLIGKDLEYFSDAGFDMSKIHLKRNAPVAQLYEDAVRYEGAVISSSGALINFSGKKTGRSPKDKRIVYEETSKDDIWWGPVNIKMDEHTFEINRERAIDYLNTRDLVYVFDGYAGWDPRYRIKVRVVCARAYHHNMLIRPTEEELANWGEPDFIIYNAGQFPANRFTTGMTSTTSVEINFKRMEMVILGTEYADISNGLDHFSRPCLQHYLQPVKFNTLSLHSSANVGIEKQDVTLFFGLSGTGKTTLSTDPRRQLIGDDEHVWSDHGVFNIEGGCYAKCINLSGEKEPEIYNAIRFGSILENVVYNPSNRIPDYDDVSITENTRCAYPIEFIPGAKSEYSVRMTVGFVRLTSVPSSLLFSQPALEHHHAHLRRIRCSSTRQQAHSRAG
ncbi:phosphoenolpyruvate carboxykinase [Rhizoctonia solani AG-1 IA]|uniref:Phosphoenolpyruvate carboxykinase (ATP) n=1 Tax=Thanatephorus cucumeris (strain AG1-IA) TaxID=983506 RepID=L8WJU1_THACA|nr:phosphoenolpyruvate carboxykinase [Rhizoctonia solani AG-1 IA]